MSETSASNGVDAPSSADSAVAIDDPMGGVLGLAGPGSNAEWTQRYGNALMGVFGQPQRVLVRGEGCYVWDADGKRYLDLLGGIAVNSLGHAHPLLISTITAQLATLGHVSNFFATPTQVALAEKLLQISHAPHGSKVFFANSGTEANEAAFKLARRTGRPRILALEGAFHGRTMGALALTHKPAYRAPFEPMPAGVEHLPFGDIDALEAAMGDDVAALFLEPLQGEAGVRPLPPGYISAARELTSRYGALLIVDEVQTGVGRTGRWLALDHPHIGEGVVPDVVTLAKGLGGGFPVGAVIGYGEAVATMLAQGQHGTTFGGNPVAAAAGLATLHVIERDNILAHVREVGEQFQADVTAIGHPLIAGARGEGLLRAISLSQPIASHVARIAMEQGFIVNAVAPDALRLAPPLIVTQDQLDTFLAALPGLLDAAADAAAAETEKTS